MAQQHLIASDAIAGMKKTTRTQSPLHNAHVIFAGLRQAVGDPPPITVAHRCVL
jgi:hypothetical protein